MIEKQRKILVKQNPQWQGDPIKTFDFKRDAFETLNKYLQYPQILAVMGLRRVGKTVLLKQIMREVGKTADSRNICYISFDDRDFQRYETAEEAIDYFLTFSRKDARRFLCLDEIQKVPNWPDLLKSVYDTESDLKMIVSGSSSLEMKGYGETLAGRIITIHMPILSFKEFARYFGLKSTISLNELIKDYDRNFMMDKEKYLSLFERYLIKGAFPELLEIEDRDFIKRYILESVIEKIVADVSRAASPRREDVAYELLKIFSKNTARLFEITNFANALKINRNTIANYVTALERSFLITIDFNYTKSAIKQARSSKKAHIAHSGIPISLFDYPLGIMEIDGEDRGHLVESTIRNSLDKASFWRTPQKDEVDIVIHGNPPLPVEVKYREHVTRADLKSLLKFMKKFKVRKGVIVTIDDLKMEKVDGNEVLHIPAWLFLLVQWDGAGVNYSRTKVRGVSDLDTFHSSHS